MKESFDDNKTDPELVFRLIVFNRKGYLPFSVADIEHDWHERTDLELPETIEKSLEILVERGLLFKTEDGRYQEAPF